MASGSANVALGQGTAVESRSARIGELGISFADAQSIPMRTAGADSPPVILDVGQKALIPMFGRVVVSDGDDCVADWNKIAAKLATIRCLTPGWDGYAAPAPSDQALDLACSLVEFLRLRRFLPSRVAPSVVGGIGITFRKGNRKVYVEVTNRGTVNSLFSDEMTEPSVVEVEPGSSGFETLLLMARIYFDS